MAFDENSELSDHFSANDLLRAGHTARLARIDNTPRREATWRALQEVCSFILEPVLKEFARPTITYGFASFELTKLIKSRIAPSLDQHAGYELRPDGTQICERGGQAADFYIQNVSSARIAHWIALHTPFDRLYFYGDDRPLHVSVGPQQSRSIIVMLPSAAGRRVPRRMNPDQLAELSS